MKNTTLIALLTTILLAGCSKSMPDECVEMTEMLQEQMKEQMESMGVSEDQISNQNNSIEQLEEKWNALSSDEKDAMEAMCKMAVNQM